MRRRHASSAVAIATLPAILLVGGEASADPLHVTINPGVIVSDVGGRAPAFGIGGEASFMAYPDERIDRVIGFGGLFQYQRYNGDHDHYVLAAQAGTWAGAELGYAYRGVSQTHAGLHAVHTAIFGSIGVLVLSFRVSIPLMTQDEDAVHPSPGFEAAFCVSAKWPIFIGEVEPGGNIVYTGASGRRLRDRGRVVAARAVRRTGFARGPAPRVSGLGARERELLAGAWARDGLMEHASIASFVRLARELCVLGAPRSLAHRALVAAREETRHARLCFALASAYAGEDLAPGPMPALSPREASLEVLAEESLADGCIGEGAAALGAVEGAATASDEAVRTVQNILARDEGGHARLAKDIVDYAASRGVRARGTLLDSSARGGDQEERDLHGRVMRAHGRVDQARIGARAGAFSRRSF